MTKVKTNRVCLMCFTQGNPQPLLKAECDRFDGSAWIDFIRKCYQDDLCDYIQIEPVTINVPDIF